MRNVVLTYGLIAGLIVSLLMILTWAILPPESDFAMSYVLGYASMLIALSMIFFAIKSYRDNYLGGSISWGKGFMVGLYVSIVASILYVIGWKIYSSIALPDFWEQYARHSIEALSKSGASQSEIADKLKEIEGYKNMPPVVEWAMTFLEIFPVGLLISAICAFILRTKRSPVSPATA